MDEDPLVLDAFYRAEESCDNGRTALGGTYTFMRSTAQYRTEQPAMTMCGAVQSYDIVENMNDLMLSC